MKKLIALIATTCLALSLAIVGVAYSSLEKDFFPEAGNNKKNSTTSTTTAPQYGRFICEEVGINVGMYNSISQTTVDNKDSAGFFDRPSCTGMILADHNYQDFSKLFSVTKGTTAYIETINGAIISLQCIDTFDGHNTGSELTDSEYVSILGLSDLTTYTCIDSCKNVRICQWNITKVTGLSKSYNNGFVIDKTFNSKCLTLSKNSNKEKITATSVKKINEKGNSKKQ